MKGKRKDHRDFNGDGRILVLLSREWEKD